MVLQHGNKVLVISPGTVGEECLFLVAERTTSTANGTPVPATLIRQPDWKASSYSQFARYVKQEISRIEGTKYMVVDQTSVGEYVANMFRVPDVPLQRVILTDKSYRKVCEEGKLILEPKQEAVITMVALLEECKLGSEGRQSMPSTRFEELSRREETIIPQVIAGTGDKTANRQYTGLALAAWYTEYLAGQP